MSSAIPGWCRAFPALQADIISCVQFNFNRPCLAGVLRSASLADVCKCCPHSFPHATRACQDMPRGCQRFVTSASSCTLRATSPCDLNQIFIRGGCLVHCFLPGGQFTELPAHTSFSVQLNFNHTGQAVASVSLGVISCGTCRTTALCVLSFP